MKQHNIQVAIADDHQLFLNSLSLMINSFQEFRVCLEATRGDKLIEKIKASSEKVDILLLDVKMPLMNGIEVAKYLSENFPLIKIVALSMNDDDDTIISMIRAGACAYLLKDMHPTAFEQALIQINEEGFYHSDQSNINYRRLIATENNKLEFNEREKKFLSLASSDRTYKQIAQEMNLSEKTIDGYRDTLFHKMKVRSRVGMVLEALKLKIISLE